jgi:prevent-host-death family protein
MDRIITAREANERFTEILREVDAGESFTLTSSGRPVARMVPADVEKRVSDIRAMFRRMDELPGIVTGPWTRDELYDR